MDATTIQHGGTTASIQTRANCITCNRSTNLVTVSVGNTWILIHLSIQTLN